jgi:hypothetical protein
MAAHRIDAGADGQLPLVSTAQGAPPRSSSLSRLNILMRLRAPGDQRVMIGDDDQMDVSGLERRRLKLDAVCGDDQPISFRPALLRGAARGRETANSCRRLGRSDAGLVLRLSDGKYHVVSRYGDVNAVVRADIEVEPGKLTEAVMRHTGRR